ncbi:MAG: hypothetical protein WBF25_03210 [Terriglobales bacterium]
MRKVTGRGHRSGLFAFATPDDSSEDVSELDGWRCRDEFLALPQNDNNALLKFLTKMGLFHRRSEGLLGHWSREVMSHYRQGNPVPVDVRGLWKFRDNLKRDLLGKGLPETSDVEFPLSFELTSAAAGVVTTTDAYHLLLATVFVDAAKRIRFKICQRKDCGKPFPLENKHKKKFCCWYCGHITTVRKNRPRTGGKKKTLKSLR